MKPYKVWQYIREESLPDWLMVDEKYSDGSMIVAYQLVYGRVSKWEAIAPYDWVYAKEGNYKLTIIPNDLHKALTWGGVER